MSYIIANATTNPYPKFHIGSVDRVACGTVRQHPDTRFIEVDEPPGGYLPCRMCFQKERGSSKKWKPIKPTTERFQAYGQTFENKAVPISRIKRVRSHSRSLWPGGPPIVVSYIQPADVYWMFPSVEAKNHAMEYLQEVLNQI